MASPTSTHNPDAGERTKIRQYAYPRGFDQKSQVPVPLEVHEKAPVEANADLPTKADTEVDPKGMADPMLDTTAERTAKVHKLLRLKQEQDLHFHAKLMQKREFNKPGFELTQAFKLGLRHENEWAPGAQLPKQGRYPEIYRRLELEPRDSD